MIAALLARPWLLATLAFVAGGVVVALIWTVTAILAAPATPVAAPTSTPGRTETPSPTETEHSDVPESAVEIKGCPDATQEVSDADELASALATAEPGDVIVMQPGTYEGTFVATSSGSADKLITLCGPKEAVLDGGGVKGGYVFHLDRAQYWHLAGFSVTNGQKGVMADGTVGSTIQGLTVFSIGDEAIHLRGHSTDNRVVGNDISDTGLRREKFGEGIYIGSADSNWCTITDCEPDRSDRNLVEGNYIHGTTSEAIDVKEGTTGGVIRGNTFDGSRIIAADSWVDVKGNDWIIEGNTGKNSPLDGFQTHEIGDGGWGTGNTFRSNIAVVSGPGVGFSLTPVNDNVVTCDNQVSDAGEGFSNVNCRG